MQFLFREERVIWKADLARAIVLCLSYVLAAGTGDLFFSTGSTWQPLLILAFLIAYYGLLYGRLYRHFIAKRREYAVFAEIQTILSLVLITLLVHYTEGVVSIFRILYLVEIFSTGFILSRRFCFLSANLSWLLYALMAWSEFGNLTPPTSTNPRVLEYYLDYENILYNMLALVFACNAFAAFGLFANSMYIKSEKLQNFYSDIEKVREKKEVMSFIDALTGVKNFTYFKLVVDEKLKRASFEKKEFALAVLDVDHLSEIKKEHGYDAWHHVLRSVAGTITDSVRTSDEVAWVDGDFCILFNDIRPADFRKAIERTRKAIGSTEFSFNEGRNIVHVTVSIGYILYPEHISTFDFMGEDREHLVLDVIFDRLMRALNVAKLTGRNRICGFEDPEFIEFYREMARESSVLSETFEEKNGSSENPPGTAAEPARLSLAEQEGESYLKSPEEERKRLNLEALERAARQGRISYGRPETDFTIQQWEIKSDATSDLFREWDRERKVMEDGDGA